jgi:long-chain-fatty-acid--CoA ligase ACSBG
VAGQMLDIVCPVVVTALRPGYTTLYFARPTDLKTGALVDRIRDVQPTIFLGVPRVWEKIAEKLRAFGAQNSGMKKTIAGWAKAQGASHMANMQLGGSGAKGIMYDLADRVVLSKIKEKLGMDKVKFVFSGAAPIGVDTLEYFGSLGLNVNEIYGMSECTAATTWSSDEAHLWGSVGCVCAGRQPPGG